MADNSRKIYTIKAGTQDAWKYVLDLLYPSINPIQTEIFLCDSYISSSTLKLFSTFKGKIKKVKILTLKITENKAKFILNKSLCEVQLGMEFEIKENPNVHDRFILYSYRNKCIMIGTSLNRLGNKDTTIIDDGKAFKDKMKLFSERWVE